MIPNILENKQFSVANNIIWRMCLLKNYKTQKNLF